MARRWSVGRRRSAAELSSAARRVPSFTAAGRAATAGWSFGTAAEAILGRHPHASRHYDGRRGGRKLRPVPEASMVRPMRPARSGCRRSCSPDTRRWPCASAAGTRSPSSARPSGYMAAQHAPTRNSQLPRREAPVTRQGHQAGQHHPMAGKQHPQPAEPVGQPRHGHLNEDHAQEQAAHQPADHRLRVTEAEQIKRQEGHHAAFEEHPGSRPC